MTAGEAVWSLALSNLTAFHDLMLRSLTSLIIACVVGLSSNALGDSPAPPYSYKAESEDGSYVFVMISPLSAEEERQLWNAEAGAEISGIRRQYSRSGLYLAADSTTPLWTVDWYAHSVFPFSDGVHLVREGPWATSGQSEGVSFFARGELLKSYPVSDLVFASWAMPHSVSHFAWRKETSIDDKSVSYNVLTIHRESIQFDARTGEIIESFSPPLLILIVLIASPFAVVLVRRSRSKKGTTG